MTAARPFRWPHLNVRSTEPARPTSASQLQRVDSFSSRSRVLLLRGRSLPMTCLGAAVNTAARTARSRSGGRASLQPHLAKCACEFLTTASDCSRGDRNRFRRVCADASTRHQAAVDSQSVVTGSCQNGTVGQLPALRSRASDADKSSWTWLMSTFNIVPFRFTTAPPTMTVSTSLICAPIRSR